MTGDGMGQAETGPLTMQEAVFRDCSLIELPLIEGALHFLVGMQLAIYVQQ